MIFKNSIETAKNLMASASEIEETIEHKYPEFDRAKLSRLNATISAANLYFSASPVADADKSVYVRSPR